MCAHHDPASHVRGRNFWLSFNPNYLHNKLSWSYYTVKYYRSGASEASGEENSLVPIAGDASRGWGLAGCQDAGAMGELWGRWEHVKARLSESRGSGVKVPSSPAAKHEWIWGNVHEYSIGCYLSLSTFFSLFFFPFPALSDFFSSTLIIQFFFLVFFFNLPLSLSFSLAVVCLRTSSPLPQAVRSARRSYLNLACPKDFWSFTQSVKKTRTLPQWNSS